MSIVRDVDELAGGRIACCTKCGWGVETGALDTELEDTPLSPCCRRPVYLLDSETLEEQLGPAWRRFIPAPPALLADSDLTAGARLLVLVLLDYRRLPRVFPGQDTLARQAGMSKKAVGRALDELEDAGRIRRARRSKRESGRGRDSDLIDLAPLIRSINDLGGGSPPRSDQGHGSSSRCDLGVDSLGPRSRFDSDQDVESTHDLELDDLDREDLDQRRRASRDDDWEELPEDGEPSLSLVAAVDRRGQRGQR